MIKAVICIIGMALYKYCVPAPLEAWIMPDYTYTEPKRKVGKRKKETPLNRKAPYPINSSINGRKVNTFNRQSQCPNKKTDRGSLVNGVC